MKIRTDFVSNSSSTAFIVIKNTHIAKYDFNYEDVELPSYRGTGSFGWEYHIHSDFWSKLNFCAIQIIDLQYFESHPECFCDPDRNQYKGCSRKWFNMLKDVCSNEFHLDITLSDPEVMHRQYDFYIDHQSSVIEEENVEMFEDQTALYNFLASSDSNVTTDNDNH